MPKNFLKNNIYAQFLLFLPLIVFPVWQRFDGSSSIGIIDSDAFWYWDTAYKWFNGVFHTERHYRPLAHMLNAIGLNLFGVNDHALKYVTAILDTFNILLVFLLGHSVLKLRLSAWLMALIYAYHSQAIDMSHHELVHNGTMTFLLVSVISFSYYLKGFSKYSEIKKNLTLLFSGLFLALSGHMHPEVFAHSAIFIFFILLKHREVNPFDFIASAKKEIVYWLTGFISIFVFFISTLGLLDIIEKLSSGASFQHGTRATRTFFQKIQRMFFGQYKYLSGIHSSFFASLIYSILGYFGYSKFIKREKHPLVIYFLSALFFAQMFLCLILISRNLLPRILYPFFPLALCVIFYVIEKFGRWSKNIKFKTIVSVLITLVLLFSTKYSFSHKERVSYIKKYSEIINKDSGRKGKVLIGPVLYYNVGSGFRFQLYLGKRAEYLYYLANTYQFDNPQEDIIKMLKAENYKYIFVGKKNIDRRMILDPVKIKKMRKVLRNIYNQTFEEYSEPAEQEFLRSLLKKLDARILFEDEGAIIYEF